MPIQSGTAEKMTSLLLKSAAKMGGLPRPQSRIAGAAKYCSCCLCKNKRLWSKPRSPFNRILGVTERISISSARRYAVTRHQLPPQYPGGSTEQRRCLEGTRKESTASGASSWTAAAHGAGTHRTPYLLAVSARLIRVAACSAVLSRCFILLLSCVDVRSWRGGGLIAQAPVHPIRAISVWPLPSPRAKRVWGSPPAAPPQPGRRQRASVPPKPARRCAPKTQLPHASVCPHIPSQSPKSQRAKTSRAQMHSPASPESTRLKDRTEC
jgi:hypothetical protein